MLMTYSNASLVLATVALLTGCSAPSESGRTANTALSAPSLDAEAWDAPDDYEFVLCSRCGERNDLGRYEIVVREGAVTDVDAPHWARVGRERGRIGFTSDYAGEAPTLSELMAEADAAEAAGADVVELTTDPEARTSPTDSARSWHGSPSPTRGCTGLPAQGRPEARLRAQGRGRQGGARPLGLLGAPLPHPRFVELQRKIVKHRVAIDAALDHGLSQGLIESSNTKIRVLTRVAFGFRSPEALIALAMLALGGYRPDLPHLAAAS